MNTRTLHPPQLAGPPRRGLVAAAGGRRAALARRPKAATRPSSRAPCSACSRPELTEGPYYIAGEKVRRDIRDGHPGTLLTLRLRVLDASTCKPIKGAAVDIWHADAAGNYSGFGAGASSRTFLRGDPEDGRERARRLHDDLSRLVPGPRRAHPRQGARRRQRRAHRPALLQRRAHGRRLPARRRTRSRPNPDMRNAQDSIFVNGGKRGLLAVTKRRRGLRRHDRDGRA